MSDKEIDQYIKAQQEEIDRLKAINNSQTMAASAQDLMSVNPQETNIIKEQLDLSEDLIRIDYLLRSYTQSVDNTGNLVWSPPRKEDILLTEYGVSVIRREIGWYINKNTLLTNFPTEKLINQKMWFFAHTLNDRIMLEYEKIFRMPTVEECKAELLRVIDKRASIKVTAYEVLGREVDKEEITKEIINEMSNSIEKEYFNIRDKLMAEKYNEFSMMFLSIIDLVHATMLRALMGEERRSIKTRSNLMELKSIGGDNQSTSNYKSAFDMFKK